MNLNTPLLLAIALILDAVIGDPDALWRRLPHPVTLIGRLIGSLDRLANRDNWRPTLRRIAGALVLVVTVVIAAGVGWAIERLLPDNLAGGLATALMASILLAGRSLYDHVAAVARAFDAGLDAARSAVSHVVGRDPGSLDEPRICRAAIETTAENFSDAVVAPALWFLLLGLPGLFAYKAINTADSMIGHKTRRHRDFGWAAARVDDLVNLPASPIAGVLIALAAPLVRTSPIASLRVMARDARIHRSPNAGWPEAAMAAALGLSLAGPRRYGGELVDDPYLNPEGQRNARPDDIRRGLRVYLGANALGFAVVLALAALLP